MSGVFVKTASGLLAPSGPPGAPGTGMNWRNTWDSASIYATGDTVSYNGSSWISRAANTNSAPAVGNSNWNLVAQAGAVGPAPVISGTSTTSATIATGSLTVTTQAGLALSVGQFIRLSNSADATVYMGGLITAYSGTSLTVNVTETSGSGTIASWNIALSGPIGAPPAWPSRQNYTPTWTNLTLGSGTVSGSYLITGNVMTVFVRVTFASDTVVNGIFYPSLPTGASSAPTYTGVCWAFQASPATWSPGIFVPGSYYIVGTGRANATSPWTWVSGDIMQMEITVPLTAYA